MGVKREFEGRRYEILFGSDVLRDGVYLELSDRTDEVAVALAEVFYFDELGKAVFSAFKEDVPLELIEWLMVEVDKEGWRK